MKDAIHKRIKNFPYQVLASFKKLEPTQAISLFCDPRGGSTWLAETLNSIPKSIIIDEPLHLRNSKRLRQMKFYWRQYIPEVADWPAAKSYFEETLQGKILHAGNCYRNTIGEVAGAQQLILKIIRGKALLPWYVRQFDFKYTPILLVRHPFALAASQLRHEAWNYDYRPFELPDTPFNDFYEEHLDFLKTLKSKEEQLTAMWCMANSVVLHHPKNDQSWISLNYENLILEPLKYFQYLFDRWQLPMPKGLEEKILKPSTTTVGKKPIKPAQQISNWRDQLSQEQINSLLNVLDYFQVTYYGMDTMPIIPANKVHLKS